MGQLALGGLYHKLVLPEAGQLVGLNENKLRTKEILIRWGRSLS